MTLFRDGHDIEGGVSPADAADAIEEVVER